MLAFTLALSGVRASLLQPTEASTLLERSVDPAEELGEREQIVAPINASHTIRQRLRRVSAASRRMVPVVAMELDVSPLRVCATEAQMLAATSLSLSVRGGETIARNSFPAVLARDEPCSLEFTL